MTSQDFGRWLVNYYGNYPNRTQKAEVWAYIKDLLPHYLDALKQVLLTTYSSTYGKPPDVAIMERCSAQAIEKMERPKALPEPEAELMQFSPDDLVGELMAKIHAKRGVNE